MKTIIFTFFLFLSTLHSQSQFRFYINNINMPMDNKGQLAYVYGIPGGTGGLYLDVPFLYSGGFLLSDYNGDTLWANGMAIASLIGNYQPENVITQIKYYLAISLI